MFPCHVHNYSVHFSCSLIDCLYLLAVFEHILILIGFGNLSFWNFAGKKKVENFFLEFLIPQLLYWKLHSTEMRCCLLLLLLLVLGLHEIWDLTGLNFERSSWHTFGISISLNKCAIWREDYSFCFIDKKTPSPTRNWLGVINAIYLGVVSQQGIKPNNQLESDLEYKS